MKKANKENDDFTILLVEDDQLLSRLVSHQLEKFNFNIITAENGVDAQEKMSENRIDSIITDLFMPEMDGIAFVRWLREDYPSIPVIVITASTKSNIENQISDLNITDIYYKPLGSEQIQQLIDSLTKQKNG